MQSQLKDPVQASEELFGKISLVAQIRSLDMRSVFKFPLGPLPWALAEPIGTLKKTSKATLLHNLEGLVEPLARVSGDYAIVFDGMAYVQQSQVTNKTFGQLLTKILVEFFVSQWKNAESRLKIGQKPFYVTSRSDVYKINDAVVERVLQLQSNHEEADTRMLLYAKQTSLTYPKVLISSPDTDVFIICLSVHTRIAANLYFLTGVKSSRRIIDVSKVSDYIFDTLKRCDVSKEFLMESDIGFHSSIIRTCLFSTRKPNRSC